MSRGNGGREALTFEFVMDVMILIIMITTSYLTNHRGQSAGDNVHLWLSHTLQVEGGR
jgi:hypothetical protein